MTPRTRLHSQRRGRFRRRVLGAVVTLALLVGGTAHALWTASSTGAYGLAQASTLTAPVLSTGSVTATSAALSWTKPFTPTSYALGQSPGSLAGCAGVPGTATSSCTATGLTPNTSYTWTLSAYLSSWVSTATASATTPKQATTTTLSNLTPTSGNVGTSFSATATVAGGSGYGTPAGTVVFALYTNASCTGGSAYASAPLTLSAAAVTGSLAPAAAGTYYWVATYTPSDTYNLPSTSSCSSTAITVTAPTSTIAFNFYNLSGSDYNGLGRPTSLTGGLSLQNSGGSVPRTLTSMTVTAAFPDTRFATGPTPTGVTGVGWSYTSKAHVGGQWVYTFTWTGSLAPYASTANLTFTVAMSDNSAGAISSTATATNIYTNSPTITANPTI